MKKDGSTEIPEFLGKEPDVVIELKYPIDYFQSFITDEFLDLIVEQSNLYAVQQNVNKPLNTTRNEIEQWLGLVFYFSITKLANTRMHWSHKLTKLMNVAHSVMSRDKFEAVKRNFHLVDNSKQTDKTDKMLKVRPLINQLRQKFNTIIMPQALCIDEQLVPFKGKSQLKQYIPSKPHKWGYKLFVLADTNGIIYDFFPYTGKIYPVENPDIPDLKASSNVVLHLAQIVPSQKNHLLYFDNWFTSLPLVQHLATREIWCCGTVRAPRIPGIPKGKTLNKELEKKERGSYEELVFEVDTRDISFVRWHDNKIVHLISNFARSAPVATIERYDSKQKKKIELPCPDIVQQYNKSMGGVDLADCLLALYRIHLRSKKYYMRLIFHMLDMAIVNSWLLYKRDAKQLKLPNKDILPLALFKLEVADALIKRGKPTTAKRGRPSSSSLENEPKKKPRGQQSSIYNVIRFDKIDHFPALGEKRNRCKNKNCNGKTRYMCQKCNVYLCITPKEPICFTNFHAE